MVDTEAQKLNELPQVCFVAEAGWMTAFLTAVLGLFLFYYAVHMQF